MKLNSTMSMVLLAAGVLGAIIIIGIIRNNAPSRYDEFSQCITDEGGVMYGAYWCENCASQKDRFGSAFRKIDYVECSSPGSQSFDLCPDVQGVPLWTDADGQELTGDVPLSQLSEFYGCELPD